MLWWHPEIRLVHICGVVRVVRIEGHTLRLLNGSLRRLVLWSVHFCL